MLNKKRLVWPLVLSWIALAVFAVLWAVPNEEDDLTAEAEAALQQAGIAASVEFEGRDAVLSGGLAGTEQERALEVVRDITGVRQAEWLTATAATSTTTATTVPGTTTTAPGGSTTLAPTTTVAPGTSPSLTASLSKGALTLSGTVSDAQVAGQVAGIADLIYGPFVTNNLVVDEGVSDVGWLPNAPNLMAFLPIVGEAELNVVGTTATLSGRAGSVEKKAQLEAALGAALGSDVTLTSTVEVTDKTPPVYTAQATAAGVVTLGGVMPDQAAIDLIANAAIDVYGETNVVNNMTIGTDIEDSFSIYRIPLTFAQFEPIDEWDLLIENDVISGNVRGGATFDFASAELTPELRTLLDTAAGILLRNPSILLTIEGHTDSVGSDSFNLALSDARAQSGVDYLTGIGVQSERLFSIGYGETRPIADNGTADGRRQNRRLEFVLGPPS